jgi:hypothetical protein
VVVVLLAGAVPKEVLAVVFSVFETLSPPTFKKPVLIVSPFFIDPSPALMERSCRIKSSPMVVVWKHMILGQGSRTLSWADGGQ